MCGCSGVTCQQVRRLPGKRKRPESTKRLQLRWLQKNSVLPPPLHRTPLPTSTLTWFTSVVGTTVIGSSKTCKTVSSMPSQKAVATSTCILLQFLLTVQVDFFSQYIADESITTCYCFENVHFVLAAVCE